MNTNAEIDINDPEVLQLLGAIKDAPMITAVTQEAAVSPVNEGNFDPSAVEYDTASLKGHEQNFVLNPLQV